MDVVAMDETAVQNACAAYAVALAEGLTHPAAMSMALRAALEPGSDECETDEGPALRLVPLR